MRQQFSIFQKANQQGFSLIELMLVMTIISALAVGAFVIYPKVQSGRQATYEAQILSSAQTGIKRMVSGDYTGMSAALARQAELFPAQMNSATAGELTNQFGGDVTLSGATVANGVPTDTTGTTFGPFFRISYTNVPTDVCIKLAPALANSFDGVRIGTDSGANLIKNATTGVFNPGVVPARCNSAANVTMEFISS